MRVMIIGGDGFCGFATAMYLSRNGHDVAILDNLIRRHWDNELGIGSLTPIASPRQRLDRQIRKLGQAREVHVRVACPPIVAPCFYGIDMSTLGELFAPEFMPRRYSGEPSDAVQAEMARDLGVDSLRYLPVSALGPCLNVDGDDLCTGCVTGKYPSPWGNKLMARARRKRRSGGETGRTYS